MFWIALVCAAWPMNTFAHYLTARERARAAGSRPAPVMRGQTT
jgi:hypothetical protein